MLNSGTLAIGYIKYIRVDLYNRDVKNAIILWWIMQRIIFLSPRYVMSGEGSSVLECGITVFHISFLSPSPPHTNTQKAV